MTTVVDGLQVVGRVRPRSVVPGRQRWELIALRGRPDIAERLEADLGRERGISVVRANPVTARLLVVHEAALSSDAVSLLVRRAVARAVAPPGRLRVAPAVGLGAPPGLVRRESELGTLALAVAGGAALVFGGPLTRLATTLGATAIVAWRGWRRSKRARGAPTARLKATRGPLRRMVGAHKVKFYCAAGLSIAAQVLFLTPALFIGRLLGVLIGGPSTVLLRLGLTSFLSQLMFLAAAVGVIFLTYAIVSFLAGLQWRDLAQVVQHEWRTEMYAHVQRAELRFLEGERTTRLAGVLTDDIDQFGRFLAAPANTLIQIATSFAFLVPVFLWLAPNIAWIAFLPAPIVVWLSFFYQERVAAVSAASSNSKSLLNSQLINNLEASTTIRSFGAEEYEVERVRQLSNSYRRSNRRMDTRTTAYNNMVQVCALASLFGLLLVGGMEVLAGTLSLAVFNGLVGLPRLLLMRLPELGEAAEGYQRTEAALGRVLELKRFEIESDVSGRGLDLAEVNGELALEKVTFAYPGRAPVFSGMSIRVAAGTTTGVVGVTGAGKTTLAKLVLRFYDVDAGRVLLDGVDIRDLRIQDLRRAIGFVGQDAFLFDGTIGENIRYGSFDADPDRVAAAARLADADAFIEALPMGYDTMVGERGSTLSGGQRQRLSLARAVLKDAPVLILDEATSAVDNETESAIQHALADFARGRTMVVIAHRLSTIRHADWIYVMGENGLILEQGTHSELLELGGTYASLWRLQIGEESG